VALHRERERAYRGAPALPGGMSRAWWRCEERRGEKRECEVAKEEGRGEERREE
jgi:hypothetical protein